MIRRAVLRLAAIAVVVPIVAAIPASLGGVARAAADEAGWAALRRPGASPLPPGEGQGEGPRPT